MTVSQALRRWLGNQITVLDVTVQTAADDRDPRRQRAS